MTLCGISRLGSSPLARGLPVIVAAGAYTGRIIPARAGFTPPDRASDDM